MCCVLVNESQSVFLRFVNVRWGRSEDYISEELPSWTRIVKWSELVEGRALFWCRERMGFSVMGICYYIYVIWCMMNLYHDFILINLIERKLFRFTTAYDIFFNQMKTYLSISIEFILSFIYKFYKQSQHEPKADPLFRYSLFWNYFGQLFSYVMENNCNIKFQIMIFPIKMN